MANGLLDLGITMEDVQRQAGGGGGQEPQGLLGRIGGFFNNPTVQGAGQGLLGAAAIGANPLLGLLAAPALADIAGDRERENTAADLQLSQAQRADRAAQNLPRLMDSAPPAIGNVETGQMEVPPEAAEIYRERQIGQLGQIAPEAVATGLLGEVFPQGQDGGRATERVTLLEDRLGRPLTEDELFAATGIAGDGMDIGDVLKRLQVEQILSEREQARETETEQRQLESLSTTELLGQGESVLKGLRELQGTFLEPGQSFMDIRRPVAAGMADINELFGREEASRDMKETVGRFDKFVKDSTGLTMNLASKLGTNLTNFQLETLQKASAGAGVSPFAIKSVVTDVMERSLRRADIMGLDIPNRGEIESLLAEMKGTGGGGSFEGRGARDIGGGVTVEFID